MTKKLGESIRGKENAKYFNKDTEYINNNIW